MPNLIAQRSHRTTCRPPTPLFIRDANSSNAKNIPIFNLKILKHC